MKKLIALILTVALLLPAAAWACTETTVLVTKSAATITYTDASYWAVTEDCGIAGIKDCGEQVPRMGVQSTHSQYIAGKLDNGWTRTAGMIRTVNVGGQIIGLTKLRNVRITIYTEYLELCETVIHSLLGEGVEISANSIAACALYWDGDFVANIFHPSYSDRFAVGMVTFNSGEDVTPLYLGHFGDELRFGLACGWWIPDPEQPKQTETNCQTGASASATATATATSSAAVNASNSGSVNNSGDGCWRNNTVLQINIGIVQTVKNCIRWLKGECK